MDKQYQYSKNVIQIYKLYLEKLKSCQSEKEFKKLWNNGLRLDWYWCIDMLCQYCHDYFKIWYNLEKINWNSSDLFYLQKYCKKYKYIWGKDYIKWKIKNTH